MYGKQCKMQHRHRTMQEQHNATTQQETTGVHARYVRDTNKHTNSHAENPDCKHQPSHMNCWVNSKRYSQATMCRINIIHHTRRNTANQHNTPEATGYACDFDSCYRILPNYHIFSTLLGPRMKDIMKNTWHVIEYVKLIWNMLGKYTELCRIRAIYMIYATLH